MTDPTPAADPRTGSPMGRTCCACLGVLLLSTFGCLLFGWGLQRLSADPQKAEAVFQSLIPHAIPPGFHGVYGVDLLGFPAQATLGPSDKTWHDLQASTDLSFLIVGQEIAADVSNDQAIDAFKNSLGSSQQMKIKERTQTAVRVRGASVTAETLEGTLQEGSLPFKLTLTVVPRTPDSDQRVLLVFVGSPTTYDPSVMQAFLDSIP